MTHAESNNAVGGEYLFGALDSLFCMAISAVIHGTSQAVSDTAKRLAEHARPNVKERVLDEFIDNPNAIERISDVVGAYVP